MKYFILDRRGVPKEATLEEWASWFEGGKRIVKHTYVMGVVLVSTIFLGMDHGFGYSERPVLWETMIFPLDKDQEYQWRYTSKRSAVIGHEEAVKLAKRKFMWFPINEEQGSVVIKMVGQNPYVVGVAFAIVAVITILALRAK
jgi:hypothetical protein